MHRYLLVKFRDTASKNLILHRVKKHFLKELPFIPQSLSVQMLSEDTLFISAVASDILSLGGYATFDSLTVYDGFVFKDGQAIGSERIRSVLGSDPTNAYVGLQGQFSVVHQVKKDIFAFEDSSGSRPIYYLEAPGWVAVSNKQSLLSPICTHDGSRSINLDAFSWLIGQGHVFGTDSVYTGVKLLKPGSYLRIKPKGKLVISMLPEQIWSSEGDKRNLTSQDYDDITHDLIQSYKSVSSILPHVNGEAGLSLTGGKDSRLGLSLATEAGLLGKLSLFTYGHPDSAEVQVAKHLSGIVGSKHTAIHGDPYQDLNIDTIWKRLRFGASRFDFSHGGIDGGYAPSTGTIHHLDLTGGYAELYKRIWTHTRSLNFDTVDQAIERWKNWPVTHDHMGLLHSTVRQQHFNEIKGWLLAEIDKGYALNDLQEIYYVENRMTWWLGGVNTANVGRSRLVPLASLKASQLAMKMNGQERAKERIHFEVIRRLSPALLSAPFLNDMWHEDIRAEHSELSLPDLPFPVNQAIIPTVPAWYNYFVTEDTSSIKSYLLDSPSTGLFDIVDYDRLVSALAKPQTCTGVLPPRQIINIILAQMALSRDQSYPKDDVRRTDTMFASNVPDFNLDSPRLIPNPVTRQSIKKRMRFDIPAAKAIRIDPTNRRGLVQLSDVFLIAGGKRESLPLSKIRTNADVKVLSVSPEKLVFESLGEDPSIVMDLPQDRKSGIEVSLIAEAGDYLDIHWDDGSGFTAEKSLRKYY